MPHGRTAPQWREIDISLDGPDVANPYTDINAWVTFTHSGGQQLRRPVFWDGGTNYRVRFASTQPEGEWQWRVYSDRQSILSDQIAAPCSPVRRLKIIRIVR